jgi:transcriptional regulator with XRE-family HTH domain
MIKGHILKAARKAKGYSQQKVAELTRERFGVGTQQGYRRVEAEGAGSKYLGYYCAVLDLSIADVDDAMSGDLTTPLDIVNKLLELPESERIAIAQKLLASLKR